MRTLLPFLLRRCCCALLPRVPSLLYGKSASIIILLPSEATVIMVTHRCSHITTQNTPTRINLTLTYSQSTNPLDMAKLRIQIERRQQQHPQLTATQTLASTSTLTSATTTATAIPTFHYKNVLDGVARIVREEGARGALRGATARIAFQVRYPHKHTPINKVDVHRDVHAHTYATISYRIVAASCCY